MSTTEQTPAPPEAEVPTTPPVERPKFQMHRFVDEEGVKAHISLPNQFQFEDIRRRALAAKARRVRQLRDPETDAFIVLDDDMDRLRREGDPEELIEEIVRKDWWRDHTEATKDARERERFAHIADDEARYILLEAMPEGERPADEYAELKRTMDAYDEAITQAREERQNPRREALRALPLDNLVEKVRDLRIEAEGDAVFNMTFSKHQLAACTREVDDNDKPKRSRYFANVEDVENADPVTIDTLTRAFNELEQQFGRGLAGNF